MDGHLLTGCHFLFLYFPSLSRFYCDYCDTYLTHDSVSSFFSASKNRICLPFATTWMDLESITLSEISQSETNTLCYHVYVESKKIKQTNVYNKTETDSLI